MSEWNFIHENFAGERERERKRTRSRALKLFYKDCSLGSVKTRLTTSSTDE